MKRWIIALVLTSLSISIQSALSAGNIQPEHTRCEYRKNPVGIDTQQPRLSWIVTARERDYRGLRQTAYRILVASTAEKLTRDQADLWDSGRVESDETIQIVYAGKKLSPGQTGFWKVRLWDGKGKASPWSKTATWTMGLLDPSSLQAKWIGPKPRPSVMQLNPSRRQLHPPSYNAIKPKTGEAAKPDDPLPLLRREFDSAKPIRRATVSICGLGQYELRLNGDRVGDHVMDPGWTDYAKTCLYSTYDVTRQVKKGKNCLGVMLGNGMYHERGERYWKFIGSYGSPKMILCMRIDYEDGTTARIVSDDAWRVATGPITLSSIYGGEDYDARLEQPGWDRPGFDDKNWKKVTLVDGPGGRLVAQSAPPIKIIETFDSKKVTQPKPGVFVYDLGQNFSGWPKLTVKGPAGTSVKITPAEVLDKNGLADQKGSGTPSFFTYTLKGQGTETWHPQFTYYGFRYLQVEGAAPQDKAKPGTPVVLAIGGQFIRCSAARAGTFACSNPLMNRIYDLIDWSIGSNLQSVLTDCPHREKLGWLEVAHLMGPSIMYNYDVSGLYGKISRDTIDSQNPNGLVPTIAPQYVVFSKMFTESPAWGSAALIVPWQLYEWYGDRRVLEDCYGTMKRYVDYLGTRSHNHIVAHGLGDWYDFPSVKEHKGYAQLTPVSLVDTAMYYEDTRILADTAALLGKTDDARHYKELAETIRRAFNRALFNTKTGQYTAGMPIVPNEVRHPHNKGLCDPKTNRYTLASQTSQAIPLALGLVEPGRVDDVFGHLVADVGRQEHLTAGDVGHRYVLLALAAGGRNDLVYKLHNRTGNPGYGWQLEQGLTALGEAWDGRSVASMNHCMLGQFQEWFHAELLGIKCDPKTVAYKNIIIRPQVIGDLKWARGSYNSIRGKITVDWRREGNKLTLKVTVPANTTATVHVPSADGVKIHEIGSGDYVFTSVL